MGSIVCLSPSLGREVNAQHVLGGEVTPCLKSSVQQQSILSSPQLIDCCSWVCISVACERDILLMKSAARIIG